jgi:transposase
VTGCGCLSSRVHGRCQRLVADGAAGGRPLLIALSVRRFRCTAPSCPRVTFVEQAEGLTGRYLRRTLPLRELLACFGLELAGRAGARLAAVLGIAVHSSTLLRLVMALPDPVVTAAPTVTGIDDFALRKGQVYGTVVADAVPGKVIDLLPDREAATLEDWLKARPGAEFICRDRATANRDGASAGAPLAVQVADRWHLWHNLGEYAEKAVAAHRGCLSGVSAVPDAADPDGPPARDAPSAPLPEEPDGLRDVPGRERVLVARTLECHAAVHALLREGRSQREAADILGLDRKTVGRFAAEADPVRLLAKATGRAGKLDPFKPWINQRWNEGITNAAAPPPKTREVTRWLLTHPDNLDPADQARLDAATAQCPHLDDLARHVRAFARIMARRQGLPELEDWLAGAEASDLPQLRSFARGIRRDQQAVTAGLSLPYSSAAPEGNVNKIKLIKRQCYGRAGFPLLRKRAIHHPA